MSHLCSQCQSTCLGYRPSELEPSPAVRRLLATNDPPAASQEEEFRSKRIDGVKRIAELEMIMEELQRMLASVTVERDAHAWEVERHRLVLNPVRRLPADILREIFLCACARSTKNPSYFYQIPPTFLAAVCRSWHHAAVTFPQLWRHCKFVMPANGVASDGAYLSSGLSFFRSATCPLWLDLHLQNLSYSNPAYPLLLSISGRIQRIRISARDLKSLESPEFRHFLRGMNTALVQMDLSIPANRAHATSPISLPHTVRHLVITPYVAFSSPTVDLNWSHLESLVFRVGCRGTPFCSVITILSKVGNLRHLTFSDDFELGCGSNPVSTPALTSLFMAHLTDLVIEGCKFSFDHLFSHLTTPSLERLTLREDALRICPNVVDMLQRSGCALRHLTWQRRWHKPGDFTLIHQSISLQELCLLGMHDAQEVTCLRSFLEPLGALRVLVLDISYVSEFGGVETWKTVAEAILEILESRRRLPDASDSVTGVKLESFTLHAPLTEVFHFTKMQRERIKALRASGLLFYICRYAQKDPRNY